MWVPGRTGNAWPPEHGLAEIISERLLIRTRDLTDLGTKERASAEREKGKRSSTVER